MGAKQIKTLEPWHENLIDWLIMNPHTSRKDCAAYFDISYTWLSMVINSDLFKERLAARQERQADLVSRTVIGQAQAVAEQSLELLSDRLSQDEIVQLPTAEVREIAALSLKTIGLGGAPAGSGGPAINAGVVNVLSVDGEVLERARSKMRETQANVVEAEHLVLPAPEPSPTGG
jgi:hypothetical protein